jgi:hypothetical protein
MIRLLAVLPLLAVAGCSDIQLANAAARHRAYVCSHQTTVAMAAGAVIRTADAIEDPTLRAAALAMAHNDLAIVAACPQVAAKSP